LIAVGRLIKQSALKNVRWDAGRTRRAPTPTRQHAGDQEIEIDTRVGSDPPLDRVLHLQRPKRWFKSIR